MYNSNHSASMVIFYYNHPAFFYRPTLDQRSWSGGYDSLTYNADSNIPKKEYIINIANNRCYVLMSLKQYCLGTCNLIGVLCTL